MNNKPLTMNREHMDHAKAVFAPGETLLIGDIAKAIAEAEERGAERIKTQIRNDLATLTDYREAGLYSDHFMLAGLERSLRGIVEARRPLHYPPGMGEESRRLHREYAALGAAQRAGAKNGAEVRALTDECSRLGIVLVPGGENL
jgi:hypothetical protein